MKGLPWFRLYHEARTDAKLAYLADDEHRVWFDLLCYAAEQSTRGTVHGVDMFLLAIETARGDAELLNRTIDKLVRFRIITLEASTITFINFLSRQYDKPSDAPEAVRERVARHRETRATAPPLDVKRDVTRSNALEERREEEKRVEETEDVPPAAVPAEPPRSAPIIEATVICSEPVPGNAPEPTSKHDRRMPPTSAPPPAPSNRPSVLPMCQTSRFQDVLNAVGAAGITLHHTSRDAAAVKSCSAEPALIAEAYVAAATGDWGDAWMLSNLSLTTICQRIPAYEAWKHGVTPKQPTRASPGRSGRGLSIQELARMGGMP